MVGRDLWKELQQFHSDLAAYPPGNPHYNNNEQLLLRALRLLQDIYAYEHTAKYN